MALTLNAVAPAFGGDALRNDELVAKDTWIYEGAALGRQPNGYVKPFEAGDVFCGFAQQEFRGAATDGGVSRDGLIARGGLARCNVLAQADRVLVPVSSLTQADIGRSVFALADDSFGLIGHPDAVIGRVIGIESSSKAWVTMMSPGKIAYGDEVPNNVINYTESWARPFGTITGASTAATNFATRWYGRNKSATGSPTTSWVEGLPGYARMLLTSDNAAQFLSFQGGQNCALTYGATLEFTGRMAVGGSAGTDIDIGLFLLASGSLGDSELADLLATANLRYFGVHIDAEDNNIDIISDNNADPVGPTDSTYDNSTSVNWSTKLIIRPTGVGEAWLNVGSGWVRALSTSAFTVGSSAGYFGSVVNVEKPSGTDVTDLRIVRLRQAGAFA